MYVYIFLKIALGFIGLSLKVRDMNDVQERATEQDKKIQASVWRKSHRKLISQVCVGLVNLLLCSSKIEYGWVLLSEYYQFVFVLS